MMPVREVMKYVSDVYVFSTTGCAVEGNDIPSCTDQIPRTFSYYFSIFSTKDFRAIQLFIQEMIMH